MDTNSDDVKKDVPAPDVKKASPPPPDIKTGPPAPPVPTVADAAPEKPAGTGLNVTIKEGSDEDDSDVGQVPENGVSLMERVGGFLIDVVVGVGIAILLTMIIPFDFLDRIANLAALGYMLTRDSLPFLDGQSVGKKAVGTRAETLDGASLSGNWQPGLIRNAVLLIPLFAIVELVVLVTREDKPEAGRRLGDEWAKTRVVKVTPKAAEGEPEA